MNSRVASINLFEFVAMPYERIEGLSDVNRREAFMTDLEQCLSELWSTRNGLFEKAPPQEGGDSGRQSFIEIGRFDLRPRNWVGSFRFRSGNREYAVNVLPKIFHHAGLEPDGDDLRWMFAHVLWWMSISGTLKVAASRMDTGSVSSDLLETLVGIFSGLAVDVYSDSAYHAHSMTEETLETVRGAMDFGGYTRNRSKGLYHRIPCRFDAFRFDNRLNRIVKYVCVMLREFTSSESTKRNLEEVLFILDEVGLHQVNAQDCDRVPLNPIHGDLTTMLDYCRLFLSSLSSLSWKDEYSVFGLMIRSESLFESLLRSILSRRPPKQVISVGTDGPGSPFLVRRHPETTARHYRMRHDIVLSMVDGSHVILDAKYKRTTNSVITGASEPDTVYGISRADMYQMISYAVGTGVTRIGLAYPADAYAPPPPRPPACLVDDRISGGRTVRIQPFHVNITQPDFGNLDPGFSLETAFEPLEKRIADRLSELVSVLCEH
jgi:5-methylcytosine-specific restriction enzyme subunit McrC